MSPAEIELRAALSTIATAALLISAYRDLFDRYEKEAQHMDSVGPILNPTLFMNPERQRVDAALRPVFRGARIFLETVETAQKSVRALNPEA